MQLNERKEKFCQNYVLHRNATRAAKEAGYSETSAHNQGSRLLREQDCIERIAELSSDITTDIDVINELEKQYDIAKNSGHSNSALKALELLSKVRGNNDDSQEFTTESLEAEIVLVMQTLGFDKIYSLLQTSFPDYFSEEDDDETVEENISQEEHTT